RAALESKKALAEEYGAVLKVSAAAKELAESREREIQAHEAVISKVRDQTLSIQDQVTTYGLGKSAIEDITIARLEESAAALRGLAGSEQVVAGIEEEIEARRQLREELRNLEGKQAAEQAAKEWAKASESIGQSLTDALLRGFESGKSFAKNLRDTVINMFK